MHGNRSIVLLTSNFGDDVFETIARISNSIRSDQITAELELNGTEATMVAVLVSGALVASPGKPIPEGFPRDCTLKAFRTVVTLADFLLPFFPDLTALGLADAARCFRGAAALFCFEVCPLAAFLSSASSVSATPSFCGGSNVTARGRSRRREATRPAGSLFIYECSVGNRQK